MIPSPAPIRENGTIEPAWLTAAARDPEITMLSLQHVHELKSGTTLASLPPAAPSMIELRRMIGLKSGEAIVAQAVYSGLGYEEHAAQARGMENAYNVVCALLDCIISVQSKNN